MKKGEKGLGVRGIMDISYWDCKYADYDERFDGEDELRIYGCTHPQNTTDSLCSIDNKWGNEESNCDLLTNDE